MKGKGCELHTSRKYILPILILAVFCFTTVALFLLNNPIYALQILNNDFRSIETEHACNMFRGDWVLSSEGPYYTNETECGIDDRQNCLKFGRPDSEFMRWRWKPNACELHRFHASQFLELVRGKTMAFLGDSVGRNQMQSLMCLLATAVPNPADVSYGNDPKYRRWLYPTYNFTLVAFWSPLLIKYDETDNTGLNSLLKLYLDQEDEAWKGHTDDLDYVIVSAGQWFFRPFVYYESGKVVGCFKCDIPNVRKLSRYYGYKMAFRTVFKTLLRNERYKGVTFVRTFSPSHFENGDWNTGGNCIRTKPFAKKEKKLEMPDLGFYTTQVEEFRRAEKEGEKGGLKFGLLDTTGAMVLRPDGHPNHYRRVSAQENSTINDCVHWCLPGPIDTWNEFLLQMLETERNGTSTLSFTKKTSSTT